MADSLNTSQPGEGRRQRGINRAYHTEDGALEKLSVESRQYDSSDREARAARLEARRKQIEEEQKAKQFAKEDEAYQEALEAAKVRAADRRAKLDAQAKHDHITDNASVIAEATDMCDTVLNGPYKDNDSVQILAERVRLLVGMLRTTTEYNSRLQTYRTTAQHDREHLQDQLDEARDEALTLRAQLRKEKDQKEAHASQCRRLEQQIAELQAGEGITPQAEAPNSDESSARAGSAQHNPATNQASAANAELEEEVTQLREEVKALEQKLAAAETKASTDDGSGLDASLDLSSADPEVQAQRIRLLESQKKRLKTELNDAEDRESELTKEKRKLSRQVRRLEGEVAALEEQLKGKDEQLRKLRDRRRMLLTGTTTDDQDAV